MVNLKRKALAKFLECDPNDVIDLSSNAGEFIVSRKEYRVMTDEEATQAARADILDSVWAFNPDFLARFTPEGVDEDAIKAIQANGRCESNNPTLRRLLMDEDRFTAEAISEDGRGHFLSGYDGEEHEVITEGEDGCVTFYIYRTN